MMGEVIISSIQKTVLASSGLVCDGLGLPWLYHRLDCVVDK